MCIDEKISGRIEKEIRKIRQGRPTPAAALVLCFQKNFSEWNRKEEKGQ
jgi:hypothetical protein